MRNVGRMTGRRSVHRIVRSLVKLAVTVVPSNRPNDEQKEKERSKRERDRSKMACRKSELPGETELATPRCHKALVAEESQRQRQHPDDCGLRIKTDAERTVDIPKINRQPERQNNNGAGDE